MLKGVSFNSYFPSSFYASTGIFVFRETLLNYGLDDFSDQVSYKTIVPSHPFGCYLPSTLDLKYGNCSDLITNNQVGWSEVAFPLHIPLTTISRQVAFNASWIGAILSLSSVTLCAALRIVETTSVRNQWDFCIPKDSSCPDTQSWVKQVPSNQKLDDSLLKWFIGMKLAYRRDLCIQESWLFYFHSNKNPILWLICKIRSELNQFF